MGRFAQRVWQEMEISPTSRAGMAMRAAGVQKTADLVRVAELPRRALDLSSVEDLTELFRRTGGTLSLRAVQSLALLEAEAAGGLVGAIGVGHGKTLILLLLAEALDAKRAVLLVPAELKAQLLERDLPYYGRHLDLPMHRVAGILSYPEVERAAVGVGRLPRDWKWLAHLAGALSSPLDALRPDLVVADEAHRLCHRQSTRTKRVLRYAKDNPGCRFAFLSGSLATRPPTQLGHLASMALRRRSPLPLDWRALCEWDAALEDGPDGRPTLPPGALTLLCRDDVEPVREGFRRRLVETVGWVTTPSQSFSGSLYLRRLEVGQPAVVAKALKELEKTWAIGEEELEDAMAFHRVARQLACGFYYRWRWPDGRRDVEWLEARRAWHREVRAFLCTRGARQGMDSPGLLEQAAATGRWRADSWPAWKAVKGRYSPHPPREAVWISTHVLDACGTWGRRAKAGIAWYQHRAFGEELGRRTGWPVFGMGADAGDADPKATPLIACSMKAQREGKNLQAWSRGLIVVPPVSAEWWEQILGRTHRPGQLADEVWNDVMFKASEDDDALEKAQRIARRAVETHGQEQKLLSCAWVET